MELDVELGQRLERLKTLAPAGFAVALHISYMTPRLLFQTYPKAWIELYSQQGLVMQDPTVHWGFQNSGTVRWRDLKDLDVAGVMDKAAEHGIVHGMTYALGTPEDRSIASFARSDRALEESEIETIRSEVDSIHEATGATERLTPQIQAVLRRLSVTFTHPG